MERLDLIFQFLDASLLRRIHGSVLKINGIEFELVKPCSRCVIPTINLETGEKQKEVMQVMLKHRKRDKNVYVGQNLIHRGVGEILISQEVKVLERY